jgi:hypothetical protein
MAIIPLWSQPENAPCGAPGRPVISAGRSKSDESWVRGKAWHGWNGHLSDRPTVIPKKNDHCSAAICSLPPLPAGGFLQRQYTVASSTDSHGLHSTPAIEAMTRTTPVYMRTMTTVDSTFIARSDIGGLSQQTVGGVAIESARYQNGDR